MTPPPAARAPPHLNGEGELNFAFWPFLKALRKVTDREKGLSVRLPFRRLAAHGKGRHELAAELVDGHHAGPERKAGERAVPAVFLRPQRAAAIERACSNLPLRRLVIAPARQRFSQLPRGKTSFLAAVRIRAMASSAFFRLSTDSGSLGSSASALRSAIRSDTAGSLSLF